GARTSPPESTDSSSATSPTVRPIGPFVGSGSQLSLLGQLGTRPVDGRSPTTLQKAAGLRSDPPTSEPSATEDIPAARAAVAPPLDPPAVRVGAYGLVVVPNTLLYVCDPVPPSGVLLFP